MKPDTKGAVYTSVETNMFWNDAVFGVVELAYGM